MSRPNTYQIIRRYPDEKIVYIDNVPDENHGIQTIKKEKQKNDN